MSRTTDKVAEIRKESMGKMALTLLIWVALIVFAILAQVFEWDMGARTALYIFGAYSSAIWAPILLFLEWRNMKRAIAEASSE